MAISSPNGRSKDECIIANKVYDQCRQQDCIEKLAYKENGQPVEIPPQAASVSIVKNSFCIGKILVVSKVENPFKRGYYDIELKFTFNYKLQFRDSSGNPIPGPISGPASGPASASGPAQPKPGSPGSPGSPHWPPLPIWPTPAKSIFNKKVTLFGSIGTAVNVATDFGNNEFDNLRVAPFVLAEANGYPLDATLSYAIPQVPSCGPNHIPNAVNVTIGLFTIIKLFRLVNLIVPSSGFCKPKVCEEVSEDPCEYFNNLEFPFDIFDPPQKEDFHCNDEDDSNQYLKDDINELDKD